MPSHQKIRCKVLYVGFFFFFSGGVSYLERNKLVIQITSEYQKNSQAIVLEQLPIALASFMLGTHIDT